MLNVPFEKILKVFKIVSERNDCDFPADWEHNLSVNCSDYYNSANNVERVMRVGILQNGKVIIMFPKSTDSEEQIMFNYDCDY